jgi:hypothetical protein
MVAAMPLLRGSSYRDPKELFDAKAECIERS